MAPRTRSKFEFGHELLKKRGDIFEHPPRLRKKSWFSSKPYLKFTGIKIYSLGSPLVLSTLFWGGAQDPSPHYLASGGAILDSFVAKSFNGGRPASSSTSVNNARRFALRARWTKGRPIPGALLLRVWLHRFTESALFPFLFSTASGPPCRTTSLFDADISRCFLSRLFPFLFKPILAPRFYRIKLETYYYYSYVMKTEKR